MNNDLINYFPPPIIEQENNTSTSDTSDTNDAPIISISECLRRHSGDVKVNGTITSISRLYKMIKSVTYECKICDYLVPINYEVPVDQTKIKNCGNCRVPMKETNHEYVNAVKVEIQDSDTFSEIEKLSCILFDENTKDIQIGSKVTVEGTIQIIKPSNRKSLPYLYSSYIQYENKQKFKLSESDIKEVQDFVQSKNNSIIESLTEMFAPSVIGLDIIKKGLLLSAVSTSEEINVNGNRDRLHVLLVGNPGIGKSKLIRESGGLVQNSRFESSQHASGKSLTAIVSKEDEDYCLRTGPVPLARGAICVLNEIGRTTAEDQGFLLDVMEEGEFTINKYGINSKIKSPTVIVASANPTNPINNIDDKIDINQIPIIKPVIDRFDLVFVLRDSNDEEGLRKYAQQRMDNLTETAPNHNTYLKKHIAYSKQFNPVLTDDAKTIIVEYYVRITQSSRQISIKFRSKRTLETLVRIAKCISKLKLKNEINEYDAREALEFFNAVIYQYAESIVSIPDNPRNLAVSIFTDILKNSSAAYSLEELANRACKINEYVKSYLLGNKDNNNNNHHYHNLFTLEHNRKLRGVYDLLIDNPHITKINDKPIVLQWKISHSLSDITDTYDIQKNKIDIDSDDDDDNPGNKDTPVMSDVSDNESNKNNPIENNIHNMVMDKKADQDVLADDKVSEVLKLNPLIGYKKPLYYCKECPKVQNIYYESILHHIQYSKAHHPK